ncbi:MAG: Fe-S-containing protein [Bacillota bacterium]
MSTSADKKARVLGGPGGQRRRFPAISVLGGAAVLVGILLAGILMAGNRDTPGRAAQGESYRLAPRRYDPGVSTGQTEIVPEFRDGKIYVDLATVEEKGIVWFKIPDQPVRLPNGSSFDYLPVTVFVAPSGRVVAAVSFCEPCSGTSFHIRGDRLVCNVCGTQWRLEDLKGVSGGCLLFPPDQVNYRVGGGRLILDEQELRSWKPRI